MNNLYTDKLLSAQQLRAKYNLKEHDFPTKESIMDYLIRKTQEERGEIFIKER
jgi:hypothetical protein